MSQGYTKGFPVDTDPTLSANSHFLVPSQSAIRSYVATTAGAIDNALNLGGIPASSYTLKTELYVVWDQANSAYVQANAAYAQANVVFGWANLIFDVANAAYGEANSASAVASLAYDQANNHTDIGPAFLQANTAYSTANLAYGTANLAYDAANNATDTWVRGQANTAYSVANLAYGQANTATTDAGSAYDTANAAYGEANSASSVAGLAFDQANNHTDIGPAFLQANTAYSVANLAYTAANNATDTWVRGQANTAYTVANLAYDQANTSETIAIAAYDQANTGGAAADAYDTANLAYGQANAAYAQGNTAETVAVAAFTVANAAGDARANVSAAGPVTPLEGVLWWNEDVGRLLVYYDDGDSQQWVDASPDSGTPGPTGPQGPIGPKSVTISYPTASEDLTLFRFDQPLTLSKLSSVLKQSADSNVAFTIRYNINRDSTGTEIKTGGFFCTSNTTGNTFTVFDNNVIPGNNYIWLETTNITGSVQELHLTIEFE